MQILNPTTTPYPCKILCFGDSQTRAYDKGIQASEYWTSKLQAYLLAAGYSARTINIGNSGWTTTQILAIVQATLARFNPDIVLYYAGVNDPGSGIAGATTQSNIQGAIDYCFANSVKAKYVGILNTNYLNYNPAVEPYATYATLRTFQAAAAAYGVATYGAPKVGYFDFYTAEYNWLSQNNNLTVNTASQIANNDQHMNANANDFLGGWIASQLQSAASSVMNPYQIR